jgi:hypothetical protein
MQIATASGRRANDDARDLVFLEPIPFEIRISPSSWW